MVSVNPTALGRSAYQLAGSGLLLSVVMVTLARNDQERDMARGKGQQSVGDDEGRKAFAAALDEIAREEDWSQAELARQLGLAQQTISKYISAQVPPENPRIVFEMERKLGQPPGSLSHHLGYVPVEHVDTSSAISRDPGLSAESRKMVLMLYRSMLRWELSHGDGGPNT
jgi:transcriptional regulator with XRE-family HTH domain